jgi:hypothetical protein
MAETEESTLEAALDYLEWGWAPVPAARRGKRPLVAWRPFQERAPQAAEVEEWFARWPGANVALVTGARAGLVVLDVDPGHGGTESLAELEARHGALEPTVEALTGGGGRHLYFAHPGGEVRNRTGLAPGLDLRGDGGLIVAPPSLHPGGRRYLWRDGRVPGQVPLAPLPRWLVEPPAAPGERAGHPPAHWRELAREGVEAGQRNAALASFTGHLLWHGVDSGVILELMLAWNRARCRPPLSDEEVARTVRSIEETQRRHQEGEKR